MEHTIVIKANLDGDNIGVQVAQIDTGSKLLSFREISHILVDSISLMVKLYKEESGKEDYKLMEEVINHLNRNFISLDSFNDGKILKPKKK